MKKIAVFASGSGSNYEALMQTMHREEWQDIQVTALICDQPKAYVLERAQQWGTPAFLFSVKEYADKTAYEQAILTVLEEQAIDFIVLAGYMRLLGSTLLKPYMGKIINLHPSLLPSFPGKDAIGQALAYGVKVSGITIHYVDEGMDTGPIIAQQAVLLEQGETQESLASKIQREEHRLYPQIIRQCVLGQIKCEGGKVIWLLRSNEH